MHARILVSILLSLMAAACQPTPPPKPEAVAVVAAEPDLLAHGEYLVRVGGCNDCHTAGYGASGGKVPKEQWLTGSDQGFLGPWGTTYPSNLRLSVSNMSEADWVAYSGSFHTRPPMPDFMLRDLPEQDRRALHRFITSLGPAGKEAPAYLPPGQSPSAPYFQLVLPAAPPDAAAPGNQATEAPPAP